jgi:hypothetical protein
MTTRLIRIVENSKCGARTQKPIVGVTGYCLKNPMITVSSLQCPPFVRCNVQRSFANPEKRHFFSLLFKSKQTHRSLFIVHRSSPCNVQPNHRTATTIKQQSSRYVQSCQLLNHFSRPADHAAHSNRRRRSGFDWGFRVNATVLH